MFALPIHLSLSRGLRGKFPAEQPTGKISDTKHVVHDMAQAGGDLASHMVRTVGGVLETTVEAAGNAGVTVVNKASRVLVGIRNALGAVVTGKPSSTGQADRPPH
jgi:hypothetical protein